MERKMIYYKIGTIFMKWRASKEEKDKLATISPNAEVGCKEIIDMNEGNCSRTYQCDYDKNRLPLL
jgi:hypothetical protein